jgi:threonine dehydratase
MGTPVIKVTRTKDYGATVKLVGSNFDEAYDACQDEIAKTGATLVHPFDDPVVIAGQGTMGLELLGECCYFSSKRS